MTHETQSPPATLPATTAAPIRRLGVIGDAHAEDERLSVALAMLAGEGVDAVVCTGDIVDGHGCPDTVVSQLAEAGVHTVRGNHDRWLLEDKARHVPNAHLADDLDAATVSYLQQLPTELDLQTVNGPLLLCHGVGRDDLRKVWPGSERMPPERSRRLDKLITQQHYSYVLNGHMHFRVLVNFERLTLINAGTLRGDHSPGFSVLDFARGVVEPFTLADTGVQRLPEKSLAPTTERRVWRNTQQFDGNWEPTRLF